MVATPTVEEDAQPSASDWAVNYVQAEDPLGSSDDPSRVRVHLLTDPWSVWCWGFEPVRRTLELRYPSIDFQVLLGGMFERVPSREERGFEIDPFFTMVQRTTGMPITTQAIHDHQPRSTYPACIHVHAVRLLEPGKDLPYLRKLREAAYLDGRNISDQAVARDVAEAVGIEAEAFDEAMASGEPEREFQDRLTWLQQADLHAYPTLIITAGERRTRVEGFQNIAGVLNVVESVSGARHPARPPPDVDEILVPGHRLATREIAEVLGASVEAAYDHLLEAEEAGSVVHHRHTTGDTWQAKGS